MKNALCLFFLHLWVVFSLSGVHAADFHAKVIHITDGDTITVLNAGKEQIKIRLNGIPIHHKNQAVKEKS
jgi:endonuclease YncB( thermonuclease family)